MKSSNTSSGSSTTCITAAAIAVLAQLFASLYLSSSNAYASSVKGPKPPAAIVFGDSVVDPGNNNYLPTVAKCNFPPYGRDFEGGKPTGRYSNGKVPSDFIVEEFGIKELLPPYLDPTLQLNDLLTGVNFASGASGYDPLSAQTANALSLTDQLRLFKEYKEKLKAGIGKDRASNIISESLYAIFIGSNDLTNTYYSTLLRRPYYSISAYTDLMIAYALRFFQELYDLGARKIGVTNLPPIGCLPSQRTLAGGPLRSCVEEYNRAAALFNSKLYSEIKSLNSQLPGSKITYLDIYNPLLSLINNPSQSGFEVVNKGCCGTGTIEVSLLCNRYQPTTCTDDTKYIFWDSYHPTEKTYRIIVNQLFNESSGSFF
ncbi:hypothetical protein Nepgr_008409 [Nepenthes gracilis]|uniref:GDSL esterase/lipase EXL3 n=1 Tax=Nepenthes gracilis TaxID=150966 RepID=A0AAD3XJ89_NEPGR|nr:hypothetical protein Nepgr_008409 [Nepenthes gracilis]